MFRNVLHPAALALCNYNFSQIYGSRHHLRRFFRDAGWILVQINVHKSLAVPLLFVGGEHVSATEGNRNGRRAIDRVLASVSCPP